MRKKVLGVGINDADYEVYKTEKVDGKVKIVWICPYYSRWRSMLVRCYTEDYKAKRPTYTGCYVAPEWHYFMTFRTWMSTQDWEGKQLDKDILLPYNKIYGPETCVFVDAKVNSFIIDCGLSRGKYPIGVYFNKVTGKYQAYCGNVTTGKKQYLGLFLTPEEAHQAWLTFKLEQAKILAKEQKDIRISEALVGRYENYKKYFGDPLDKRNED